MKRDEKLEKRLHRQLLSLCKKEGRIITNLEAKEKGFSFYDYYRIIKQIPTKGLKSKEQVIKDELYMHFQILRDKLKKIPSANDFNKHAPPFASAYQYHFGSFKKAVKYCTHGKK